MVAHPLLILIKNYIVEGVTPSTIFYFNVNSVFVSWISTILDFLLIIFSWVVDTILFLRETAPATAYSNWNYTLDDENNIITLNYYTGFEADVIVYANYIVNGKTYKTQLASNIEDVTMYTHAICLMDI